MAQDASTWREIPGYPGYSVTSDGRVFSTKGKYLRELKQQTLLKGHKQVALYPEDGIGKPTWHKVHRLVAQAFLLPPEDPSHVLVRHLDDDPSNNDVSNLAWGTQSDNMVDAVRNGSVHTSLTAYEVLQVRELLRQKIQHYYIAKQFGVNKQVISDISAGRTWKHLR